MNKPMVAGEVSAEVAASISGSALDAQPIRTGAEYVESLRNRNLTVYLMGELVGETVDHPIIRPRSMRLRRLMTLPSNIPTLLRNSRR